MSRSHLRPAPLALACLAAVLCRQVPAQEGKPAKPSPDLKDVKYGPHARNVLDLWKAKSDAPTPVVVYIHGGGFQAGDKSSVPLPLLRHCLKAGISVAAINYRLSQQAPFPAPMLDGARAVQFLRHQSKDYHLDPRRVAATGGSAGAGISLWVGFHDDLADPRSDDPVARQSSRLTCMGVLGAQTSYDPRWIKKVIGGRAHEHPALRPFYGLKPGELDSPRAHKLYEEASPINHLSAGDPPAFLIYNEPKGPLPEDAKPGQGIHHPRFGVALKEKMDPLKIECVLRHSEDYKGKPNPGDAMYAEMVSFFRRHFDGTKPGGAGGPGGPGRRPGEVNTPPARGERQRDTLKVGDPAPDFTLPDPAGKKKVTLSGFKGKKPVVLIFGSFT
jgi:acetyl esterase/lipase